MKRSLYFITGGFLLVLAFNCKEPYALPSNAVANTNFLVVEGNINVNADSTVITLSHTKPLNDTSVSTPETGAQVSVETDNGGSFPLQELDNGRYGIAYIAPGSGTEKYRLDIKTAAGKQYVSDYVEYKSTPPIDSVSWEQHGDGVRIYVYTHDNQAKSKYYKWDFIETWKYHAPFQSVYEVKNQVLLPRNRDSLIYTCWHTIPSSNIFIQSTARLSSDVVYKKELVFIPASTEKIEDTYSILVKQTVLTEAGFNYWDALSKLTEQVGSLFDALPSELTGNVHSVSDAREPVIGFITATNVEQQRIYISKNQLTDWAYPPGPYDICDTIHLTDDSKWASVYSGNYTVIDELGLFQPYYAAPLQCADCRLSGGVTTKPPFWP